MSYNVYICEIIRFTVGFILLSAACSKTLRYRQFSESLYSSFHLPKGLCRVIAPSVVALEWLFGLALLGQVVAAERVMFATFIMLSLFTLVVTVLFIYQGKVNCSCFGEGQRALSELDIVRNLMLLSAMIYYLINVPIQFELLTIQVSLLAFIGLACTIVCIYFHDLVVLFVNAGERP